MLEWGRTTDGVTTITRDGTPVATARRAAMRGDMHVDIGGARWLFFAGRGELLGERSGAEQPTLRATRPRRSRHTWDVRADEVDYRVQRTSRLRGQFVVRRDDIDLATGTAGRLRRASLDFHTGPRVEHEVFVLWLIGADHGKPKRLRGGGQPVGPPIPGANTIGGGLDAGPM